MDIKGAIFDVDGTLLDSMFLWDGLGSDYLKSIGITPEEGLKEILWPMTMAEAAQYFQTHYGVKASVEEIVAVIDQRIEYYYKEVLKLKEGVAKYLEKLKSQSVKMCIATASNRRLIEAALRKNGVLHYFDFILTCGEFGSGKDIPDIYLECQKRLGTPKEQTWIYEDALHAVKTAKNAGFLVVAVYDDTSKSQTNEIREAADIYWERF